MDQDVPRSVRLQQHQEKRLHEETESDTLRSDQRVQTAGSRGSPEGAKQEVPKQQRLEGERDDVGWAVLQQAAQQPRPQQQQQQQQQQSAGEGAGQPPELPAGPPPSTGTTPSSAYTHSDKENVTPPTPLTANAPGAGAGGTPSTAGSTLPSSSFFGSSISSGSVPSDRGPPTPEWWPPHEHEQPQQHPLQEPQPQPQQPQQSEIPPEQCEQPQGTAPQPPQPAPIHPLAGRTGILPPRKPPRLDLQGDQSARSDDHLAGFTDEEEERIKADQSTHDTLVRQEAYRAREAEHGVMAPRPEAIRSAAARQEARATAAAAGLPGPTAQPPPQPPQQQPATQTEARGQAASAGEVQTIPPTSRQIEADKVRAHHEQLRAEASVQADNQLHTQAVLAGAKDQPPPTQAKGAPEEKGQARTRWLPSPSYPVTLESGRIFFFFRPKADVAHPHNLDTLQRFDIVLEVLHRPTSASARAPLRPSLPASPAATRAADFAPAQKAEEGAGDGGAGAGGCAGNEKEEKGRDGAWGRGSGRGEGGAGAVGPVTGVEGVGLGGFGEPKKAQQQRPPTVGEAALQQVFGGEQWRAEQQERPQGQEELVPPPVGAQARRVEEITPGSLVRQITVSKKHLPSVYTHERFFAYVSAIGHSVPDLVAREEHYVTERKGVRFHPADRVAGCGTYIIYTYRTQPEVEKRGPTSTRLAYVLELPLEHESGECQQDLGIEHKGVLAIAVKNPQFRGDDAGPPFGPAISRNPHYTAEQLATFQGQRWGSCEDLSLLDAEGAELLLIGARHEPPKGNMEDALKHISYQTFIKHRQDLSKQGGAPDTEHAAAQAAMRDADGNMIVAAYKDLLVNMLRKSVGDPDLPPQHTPAVPSAELAAGGGGRGPLAEGAGTSLVSTAPDGTVHVMDVPLTSGALAEMVKQQQQQQQQVAHEPEKDPIPTLPAETGKWL